MSDADAGSSPDRSRLVLLVIGGVVLLALVAGAVAAALREPLVLDPSTPEGTVQAYVSAVLDGDYTTAAGYLAADIREDCEQQLPNAYVPESLSITLERVDVREAGATVVLEMRQSTGGVFSGPSEYTFVERFQLERTGDSWVISNPPWPVHYCETAR